MEHSVLLYYCKVYHVVCFYPLTVVTYLWACTNVYYYVEHIVLIMALLVKFSLFY
jgi:hypothetical protein